MVEIEPEPELPRTFTAHNLAPGATPATPIVLSLAAAIPATWVPCPLSSFAEDVPETNVFCLYTFKSGWESWRPVSMIAISVFTLPAPFPDIVELKSQSTLLTPLGSN